MLMRVEEDFFTRNIAMVEASYLAGANPRQHGSSRPEGAQGVPLIDEIRGWGLSIDRVDDVVSPEHGFVITQVVSLAPVGAR